MLERLVIGLGWVFGTSSRRRGPHGWALACFGCALTACGTTSPQAASNGSSETHFLRSCTDSCGGGLTCACGVCTTPCSDDDACAALLVGASCEVPAQAGCDGPVEGPTCDLVCRGDAECASLGGDHRCRLGVCRAAATPDAGMNAGNSADSGAGSGTDAGNATDGSASAGTSGGTSPASPAADASAGVECGSTVCATNERCCDPCSGTCVDRNARIECVADSGPVVCEAGIEPPQQGQVCGPVVCGLGQNCCDRCLGLCIPAASGAFCPDDADPNRSCDDAGGQTEVCADVGGSCLATGCCAGLTCCSGVPIPAGQAVCYASDCPDSDQSRKRDIVTADTDAILSAVASLPIARWRYTDDPSAAPHIGPMAQDFHAAFQVGGDERSIAKVDGDGVSLAAIQALYRRVLELERSQRALDRHNQALEAELDLLRRRSE